MQGWKKFEGESPRGPKPGWRPGAGFPIIEKVFWDEAIKNEEYRKVLQEIKSQIKKLAIELLTSEEKKELVIALKQKENKKSL